MIVIATERRNGRIDLVVVLSEDNIERMRRYDPAQVDWHLMPPNLSTRLIHSVGIAFATAAELTEIERISANDPDWKEKALKMLSRNFEFRPDLGDHDFGPTILGKPTEGIKP